MTDWLLLFRSEDEKPFSFEEFSFQLIVAKENCPKSFLESGRGGSLWIGFKKNESEIGLLSLLSVSEVAEFVDDYGPAGYLISGVKTRSIRLARPSGKNSFFVNFTSSFQVGVIQKISSSDSTLFKRAINITKTNFSGVRIELLRQLGDNLCLKSDSALARMILYRILERTFLSELIRLPKHRDFSVVVSTALQVAAELGEGWPARLRALFLEIDPFREENIPMLRTTSQKVDTLFTAIRPEEVFARTFIAGQQGGSFLGSIAKTELAEKRHQDILRAISERFLTLNVVPFESDSVDLMAAIDGVNFIFEIKSATIDNFLSQASKGIFQLLVYSVALESESMAPVSILVIENSCSAEEGILLKSVASKAGIQVLFFDLATCWPTNVNDITCLDMRSNVR